MSSERGEEEKKARWLAHQEDVAKWSALLEGKCSSAADYFQWVVGQHAEQVAMECVETGAVYTYHTMDERSNQVAHWALQTAGIQPGQVVALLMDSSPNMIITWLGLAKIGVITALINTHLAPEAMHHAITVAAANTVLVCFKQFPDFVSPANVEVLSIWSDTTWISTTSVAAVDVQLRAHVQLDDPLLYIYTSGTTGPSKAAFFSHRRFIGAGVTWHQPMALTPEDRYYIVLPCQHGNGGVVGISSCWLAGCSAIIRSKFSATNFWKDVDKFQCTAMIYIGELWRYLYNQAPAVEEENNSLRVIAGNGLSAEIWDEVVQRFGIETVVEHYGLTEMPAGPYMNFYGKTGACGYIPTDIYDNRGEDKIICFDVASNTPVRDPITGWCREITEYDVCGESIFKLDKEYRGYTDGAASERRMYRDVFKQGDRWFATGDLLRRDADGFFYFCDRVGDTFRWKGENVSTLEVSQVLYESPFIREANVYGVVFPHREGRCGMAAVMLDTHNGQQVDTRALYAHLAARLPSYAIPLFLRILTSENAKTSTLKLQKFKYQKEGFNPEQTGADCILFADARQEDFVPLTKDVYLQLVTDKTYRL